jgi:hypothetical protein
MKKILPTSHAPLLEVEESSLALTLSHCNFVHFPYFFSSNFKLFKSQGHFLAYEGQHYFIFPEIVNCLKKKIKSGKTFISPLILSPLW